MAVANSEIFFGDENAILCVFPIKVLGLYPTSNLYLNKFFGFYPKSSPNLFCLDSSVGNITLVAFTCTVSLILAQLPDDAIFTRTFLRFSKI